MAVYYGLFSTLFLICCSLEPNEGKVREVQLQGAGASFPSAVYKVWMPNFKVLRAQFVDVNLTYDVTGSGTGKNRIKGEALPMPIYAGSDSLLSDQDYTSHPDLQMFPTMAGAVVLAFNIKGIQSLNLTQKNIIDIYNGSITFWDDPTIQINNPANTLPHEEILPVARADKSGTTEMFTDALSHFSKEWETTFGTFSSGSDNDGQPIKWKPGVMAYFGHTNRGLSGLVLSLRNTIGYLSMAEAKDAKMNMALIGNRQGVFVAANAEDVQSAMNYYATSFTGRMTASLANAGGALSYPIAGYTYFIVHMSTMPDCEVAMELFRYIEWFLYSPQAHLACESLNMVPLSKLVADAVMRLVLRNMTCSGKSLKAMVEEEKRKEELALQTWRQPVYISTPFAIILIALFIAYIVYQQYKLNKALIKKEWKIDSELISLLNKRQNMSVVGSLVKSNASGFTDKSSLAWTTEAIKIGIYNDFVMLLRFIYIKSTEHLTRQSQRHLLNMRTFKHQNVLQFYGVTVLDTKSYLVSEHCPKGILGDILHNDRYNLDNNFKFSMSIDIATGMQYLHSQDIVHGLLTAYNCYIDSRWNVKIGDWEYYTISKAQKDKDYIEARQFMVDEEMAMDDDMKARAKFWMAPELLSKKSDLIPKKHSDVYSFAIVVVGIFARDDPYQELTGKYQPTEIIRKVLAEDLRPAFPEELSFDVKYIVNSAWDKVPTLRPTFTGLVKNLKAANPTKKSVLDCMMQAVEEYVANLEDKIEERTAELAITMKNMESLLHKMLPPSVATKLSKGETIYPESFECVTIYFSDIVGFTDLAASSEPMQVVEFLNSLYTSFDDVVDQHDVYKVETIGDAYMVISGLPNLNGKQHAGHIASMAIDLACVSAEFQIKHRPGEQLKLRVGVHSGPVCAGVVGQKMPRYCLFGDTVNMASRMESTSVSMKIQVSDPTKRILDELGGYITDFRGKIPVKGKGEVPTYWLHGKESHKAMPEAFLRLIGADEVNLAGK